MPAVRIHPYGNRDGLRDSGSAAGKIVLPAGTP